MADENQTNQSHFLSEMLAFRITNIHNWVHEYHLMAMVALDNAFYWYGTFVARFPIHIVVSGLVFCLLTSIPLIAKISEEGEEIEPKELWIPKDSESYLNSQWVDEQNLELDPEQILVLIVSREENGNLLNIERLKLLIQIHAFVQNFTSTSGVTYKNECLQIPPNLQPANGAQIQQILKDMPYPKICWLLQYIMLEMGTSSCPNFTPFLFLTNSDDAVDIIEALDTFNGNDSFLLEHVNELRQISNQTEENTKAPELKFIGGIERDANGNIEGAKAMMMSYIFREQKTGPNADARLKNYIIYQKELKAYLVSEIISSEDMEKIEILVTSGTKREVLDTLKDDVILFKLGCLLVVLHLVASFSVFNTVEQRVWLAICGLLSCGLSVVSMNGVCQMFGLPFNVLGNNIMILLFGIGVDDMFVVIQTVKSVKYQRDTGLEFAEWFGKAVRHAGGSIFMTSLTDCLAFGIGGLSVLPALKNTCLYASIGVVMLFVYMITFFMGCVVLDEWRINDKRDGCLCCLKKSEDWVPTEGCFKEPLKDNLLSMYINLILHPPIRAIIICIGMVNFGVAVYGTFQLEVDFNPSWYLDPNSEVFKIRDYLDLYFDREQDYKVNLYVVNVTDLPSKLNDIEKLISNISDALSENNHHGSEKEDEEVVIDSFIPSFNNFVRDKIYLSESNESHRYNSISEEEFLSFLPELIYTSDNMRKWKRSLIYAENETLRCGEKSPPIQALSFPVHKFMPFPASITISRLHKVTKIIDSYGLGGRIFIHMSRYEQFLVMDVLRSEVFRNILLAMVAVLVCTQLVLCNVLGSIIVSINVLISLINVCGYLYFLGMNIETVSTLFLTVAQGIIVDYSAHIVHCFLKTEGQNKNERVKKSMMAIGPAVFNSGTSTFACFCLCAFGTSPITFTFFKVFTLIVLSGLFGAFIVLPIILSLVGPANNENYLIDVIEELPNDFGGNNSNLVEDVGEARIEKLENQPNANNKKDTNAHCNQVADSSVQVFEKGMVDNSTSKDEPSKDKVLSQADNIPSDKCISMTENVIIPPHFVPSEPSDVFKY